MLRCCWRLAASLFPWKSFRFSGDASAAVLGDNLARGTVEDDQCWDALHAVRLAQLVLHNQSTEIILHFPGDNHILGLISPALLYYAMYSMQEI